MFNNAVSKYVTAMVAGGRARRITPALPYPVLESIYLSINIYNIIYFCSLYRHMLPELNKT